MSLGTILLIVPDTDRCRSDLALQPKLGLRAQRGAGPGGGRHPGAVAVGSPVTVARNATPTPARGVGPKTNPRYPGGETMGRGARRTRCRVVCAARMTYGVASLLLINERT